MRYTVRLILALLLFSSAAVAQWRNSPYNWQYDGVKNDSLLILPKVLVNPSLLESGAIRWNPSTLMLQVYNGTTWDDVAFANNETLQTVTTRGASTTVPITITTTPLDGLTIKQAASGNFGLRWAYSNNNNFGRIGDLGTANSFEIASYTDPLALTSLSTDPIQMRVNDSLIQNIDDTLVTFNVPVAGPDPAASNHFVTKNFADANYFTFNTKLTPLLTQPAIPIQPTDSLTQALGKLQAQFNNISGTYIENQNIVAQTANIRINGHVQAGAQIRATGWYSAGDRSGLGMELGVTGGLGQLIAWNGTSSGYGGMRVDGSSLLLNGSSAGNVGIRNSSPAFNLDITGTTRIGGANYKLFIDRTAVATQDNVIAWRSPGPVTTTDTIAYAGLASRADNTFFLTARRSGIQIRVPADSLLSFSTHIEGIGTSRKTVTLMRNGKWRFGDSILAAPRYPIDIDHPQDTSLFANKKIVANGVLNSGIVVVNVQQAAITTSTALTDQHTVRVTTAGITVTFPASPVRGHEVCILNHAAGSINTSPAYVNYTGATASVIAANSGFTFRFDGTNWLLIK